MEFFIVVTVFFVVLKLCRILIDALVKLQKKHGVEFGMVCCTIALCIATYYLRTKDIYFLNVYRKISEGKGLVDYLIASVPLSFFHILLYKECMKIDEGKK